EGAQVSLLKNVPGLAVVLDDGAGGAEQSPVVPTHDLLEGHCIAGGGACGELGVGECLGADGAGEDAGLGHDRTSHGAQARAKCRMRSSGMWSPASPP